MLPGDIKAALSDQAHRRGMSIGALIRKALERELAQGANATDPFLSDTRVAGQSAPANVAENHDAYLCGDKS